MNLDVIKMFRIMIYLLLLISLKPIKVNKVGTFTY